MEPNSKLKCFEEGLGLNLRQLDSIQTRIALMEKVIAQFLKDEIDTREQLIRFLNLNIEVKTS